MIKPIFLMTSLLLITDCATSSEPKQPPEPKNQQRMAVCNTDDNMLNCQWDGVTDKWKTVNKSDFD